MKQWRIKIQQEFHQEVAKVALPGSFINFALEKGNENCCVTGLQDYFSRGPLQRSTLTCNPCVGIVATRTSDVPLPFVGPAPCKNCSCPADLITNQTV
jgi:hypothetical protein